MQLLDSSVTGYLVSPGATGTSFQPLLIGNPLSTKAVQTPDCFSATETPTFGKVITGES